MKSNLYAAFILFTFFIANLCTAQALPDSLSREAARKVTNGDYADALKLNIEILKNAQKEKNKHIETEALYQTGRVYYYIKDYRQALNNLFAANKIGATLPADSVSYKALRLIGSIYQETEKTDSSLYFYTEAKKKLAGANNPKELSSLYGVLGELYLRQLNNDAEAKECFDLCEKYALLSGDTSTIAFSYIKKSIYSSFHGDCVQGEAFAQNAYKLYSEIKEVDGEMYAINVIFFAKTRCSDRGLYDLISTLQNMRDSIFHVKTSEKIAKYKTLYETEKTNAENKDLIEDTRWKNTLLAYIISISVSLLLLLWLAYNRYRIKKENEMEKEKSAHRALQYKAVIEAEEKERTRIARELHDSIGQILSTAKMNVSVVKPNDNEDETVLENAMDLIDKAVKEVRTISHNLMPSSLTEIGLGAAIKELVKTINTAATINVKLDMSEDLVAPKDTEVIVYRVIQEIFHNIIKHARATEVLFRFYSSGGQNTIEITDNGTGFDTAGIALSKGIGWKNIFLRVELLNGKIMVNSEKGKGTSVTIEFRS